MTIKLAETTTIPKLAKASGIPTRTMFRRLMAMHAEKGGWMYRAGRVLRVNVKALNAAHPGACEPTDLVGRVEDLEERVGSSEYQIKCQAGALGQVVRRVAQLESERRRKAA